MWLNRSTVNEFNKAFSSGWSNHTSVHRVLWNAIRKKNRQSSLIKWHRFCIACCAYAYSGVRKSDRKGDPEPTFRPTGRFLKREIMIESRNRQFQLCGIHSAFPCGRWYAGERNGKLKRKYKNTLVLSVNECVRDTELTPSNWLNEIQTAARIILSAIYYIKEWTNLAQNHLWICTMSIVDFLIITFRSHMMDNGDDVMGSQAR